MPSLNSAPFPDVFEPSTLVNGIVCRKCDKTLPEMTMADHLDGKFNQECPHLPTPNHDLEYFKTKCDVLTEVLKFKSQLSFAKPEIELWSHIKELHNALRDGLHSKDITYKDLCLKIALSNLLSHVKELIQHLDNHDGAVIGFERLDLLERDVLSTEIDKD